jgi:hypothetical protein
MVEPDEGVGGVDACPEGVEADLAGTGPGVCGVAEPGGGESAQAGALGGAESFEGTRGGRTRGSIGPAAAGGEEAPALDLGEDEDGPIEDDQVDLAAGGANVAGEEGEAEVFEVREREVLAETPEGAAGVGARGAGGAGIGEAGVGGGRAGGHGCPTLGEPV